MVLRWKIGLFRERVLSFHFQGSVVGRYVVIRRYSSACNGQNFMSFLKRLLRFSIQSRHLFTLDGVRAHGHGNVGLNGREIVWKALINAKREDKS